MNLMHSCKRAAELLSRRLDEPLGMVDDLLLTLHLSMCRNCSEVERQMEHLHHASARLFADDELPPGSVATMSPEAPAADSSRS